MYSKCRKYWILHSIIRENKPTGSYVVIKTGKARQSQANAPERWTWTFHFQKKVKSSPSNSFQHSTLHSLYILFCCFSWQMLAPLIKVASLVTCSKRHKPVPYVFFSYLMGHTVYSATNAPPNSSMESLLKDYLENARLTWQYLQMKHYIL